MEAIIIVPDIRRFRDFSLFEKSFKNALKAVVMRERPVIFMIEDNVHSDMLYYDLVYNFLSSFRSDKLIFSEDSFLK